MLRQGFRYFNKFMLLMWRLGLSRWGMRNQYSGWIMVIIHTGRKSGLRRRTPVNYAIVGGDIYCTAGFGALADWYRNLVANPQVEVWLPDGWWAGSATDVTMWPAEQRLPVLRQVLINSGFAAYAAGIDPRHLSDAELAEVTAAYKLIRIQRMGARTGPDGPGDLAWVWQAATVVLGAALLWRNRRLK